MTTFTPARPYLNSLTDDHGRTWQFAYWGSMGVYIREVIDGGTGAPAVGNSSRDEWPYLIDLNYHSMRRDDVTPAWLDEHAASWVADRSNEDPSLTP